MTATDIVLPLLYLLALFTALMGARAWLAARRLRAAIQSLEKRADQADQDRAFALWAQHTMLCVTDDRGYIWASTLHQVHASGQWDHIWETPVATTLWNALPDTLNRFTVETRRHNRGECG